jgi:hypothetical protein
MTIVRFSMYIYNISLILRTYLMLKIRTFMYQFCREYLQDTRENNRVLTKLRGKRRLF